MLSRKKPKINDAMLQSRNPPSSSGALRKEKTTACLRISHRGVSKFVLTGLIPYFHIFPISSVVSNATPLFPL